MFRKTILAAALAATLVPVSAADYYLVAPVRGKTVNASAIQVALAPASIPGARVGAAYSYDFKPHIQVTGDQAYTGYGVRWALVSGALPAGLALNPETGVVTGTPTADGVFDFALQATYKTKQGGSSYQVAVASITVGLSSANLSDGKTGQPFSYAFKPLLSVANDDSYTGAGVTWTIVAGSLPAGLALDAVGTLAGTPTAAGTSNFTVRATYKTKQASQGYTLAIKNADLVLKDGYRVWADGTLASSCKEYRTPSTKTYSGDIGDGVYRIRVGSDMLDVHCDMTTDGGGWTMWYSSSGYYHLASAVTNSVAYGTPGYSRNLKNLPFREIIYVQHSTGNKDWFTRDNAATLRVVDNIGANNVLNVIGSVYGTWTGKGGADARYKYELTMGDNTWMQVGLMMSGHTDTCWKAAGSWCSDTSTNFYRLNGEGNGVNDTGFYRGVAFRQNGHTNVAAQLMSVGVR